MGRTGTLLRCIDCGAESDQLATGWRAYFARAEDDEPEGEIATFCSDCAEDEFGPLGWEAQSNSLAARLREVCNQ
jgi:hypothetical protein